LGRLRRDGILPNGVDREGAEGRSAPGGTFMGAALWAVEAAFK